MLSILLLGSPQIISNGQPLKLPRRKSRALVYYLASQGRPQSREHLLAFFWPDTPRAAAQQTLRASLYGLRKALGAALVIEEDQIGLASDVDVDARRLEAALRTDSDPADLQAVIELYRGDFLAGFSLPDSASFEDWAAIERERYRRLAVRGLVTLSQAHQARQEFGLALETIDRALAFDRLQEDLQREGIRLAYLAGDRPEAIRRYDQLRRLLDEEMGVPPMVETRALYDAILADNLPLLKQQPPVQKQPMPSAAVSRSAAPPPLPAMLPFIGREAELQALAELQAGRKLALIEGEPGIGKTRLANEYLRRLDYLSLIGAGRELEQALPYQPLIEALRSLSTQAGWPAIRNALRLSLAPVWRAETARLMPGLLAGEEKLPGIPTSPAEETRLWEGLHQLLLALSKQRPVAIFIDDLQWADASTLGVLGYLVRQAAGAKIVFLATTRLVAPRTPLSSLVQTLTRENRLGRLPLGRLQEEAVAAIARQINPADPAPLADWLQRSSEGNPYVLAELLRYSREHSLLTADGRLDAAAVTSPIVPQTVYNLIQSRLARLAEPSRRFLDTAVAAGREFEFEVVARAAGLSESAALDALDELSEQGILIPIENKEGRHRGNWYRFDHSLTMEVAYREVSEPRHLLLHIRVAEALEYLYAHKVDEAAGLIATHFTEGNAPERAAPYAYRAGQHAARLAAWREAAAFYEQALAYEQDESRRRTLLMALSEAHFRAGDTAQASETFRAALALAHPGSPEEETARLALAQSLLTQARFAEAISLARHVQSSANPENAFQAQFTWGTALSLEGADLASAADHLRQAEAIGNRLGNPLFLSQVKFELGSVAAQQGDLPQAVELYKAALQDAEEARNQPALADAALPRLILAYNNLAYHLHLLESPDARQYAQTGLALAQANGVLGLQTYLHSTLGEIALAANNVAQAEAQFNEGLALAERLAIPERIAGLTANLGLVASRRNQSSLAIHRLSTALAQADSLGLKHLGVQIRLWLAPLLPPPEARARLAEARLIAESGGRRRLLEEAEKLLQEIG
jgi:DNA-binding SARP family transcriptional activator/predicted ATPase